MTQDEIQQFKEIFLQANNSIINTIKTGLIKNSSEETKIFMAEQKQINEVIDDKLDSIITKVNKISAEMLCKTDASDKYATKNEMIAIRGKMNFYVYMFPVLTALLGSAITYIIFR